jgi:hypothetical protein
VPEDDKAKMVVKACRSPKNIRELNFVINSIASIRFWFEPGKYKDLVESFVILKEVLISNTWSARHEHAYNRLCSEIFQIKAEAYGKLTVAKLQVRPLVLSRPNRVQLRKCE